MTAYIFENIAARVYLKIILIKMVTSFLGLVTTSANLTESKKYLFVFLDSYSFYCSDWPIL